MDARLDRSTLCKAPSRCVLESFAFNCVRAYMAAKSLLSCVSLRLPARARDIESLSICLDQVAALQDISMREKNRPNDASMYVNRGVLLDKRSPYDDGDCI